MNTLLFTPQDVLFFRDGRPMEGSLQGNGAAWPMPHSLNAALHAFLHRSSPSGHRTHSLKSKFPKEKSENAERSFGSLLSVGPFPVKSSEHAPNPTSQTWYFPRPFDAHRKNSTAVTFLPVSLDANAFSSSLPAPLKFAVANLHSPSKDKPAAWWSQDAWKHYLQQHSKTQPSLEDDAFLNQADIADQEQRIGIGICPETQSQNETQFFSASYLRLRPAWKLGMLAQAKDPTLAHSTESGDDLIQHALRQQRGARQMLTGGQQRVCQVDFILGHHHVLPQGMIQGFHSENLPSLNPDHPQFLVKWVLLTPAIFPKIENHLGGWLPSWVHESTGDVMLKAGDTTRLPQETRSAWRRRIQQHPRIQAKLVAAMVDKAIPVSGFSIVESSEIDQKAGPKSTHLAVPAGSVYYFACDSEEAAKQLASALNWHGAHPERGEILNRRSTLLGEKGFGIGVCSTWNFHPQSDPA